MKRLEKVARRDPTHDGDDVVVYEVEVDTDEDGDGSTMIRHGDFADPPALVVSSASGVGGWTQNGATQAVVTVTDGDAESTVAATVVAFGTKA